MRKRSIILLCIICLLGVGLASGAVFTLRTIAMYSQVCSDNLHGFPGLLQAAGFVPGGACKVNAAGACLSSQACVVNGKRGHCDHQRKGTQNFCICIPNGPSH
jgi:hypothetical protein